MVIDIKHISGKQFIATNIGVGNNEFTCIGYGQNDTFLIIGAQFDSTNNRSHVKTFKLSDVQFKGNITATTLPGPQPL